MLLIHIDSFLPIFLNSWTFQIFKIRVLFFAVDEPVYKEHGDFFAVVPFCCKTCFLGASSFLRMLLLRSKTLLFIDFTYSFVYYMFLTAFVALP